LNLNVTGVPSSGGYQFQYSLLFTDADASTNFVFSVNGFLNQWQTTANFAVLNYNFYQVNPGNFNVTFPITNFAQNRISIGASNAYFQCDYASEDQRVTSTLFLLNVNPNLPPLGSVVFQRFNNSIMHGQSFGVDATSYFGIVVLILVLSGCLIFTILSCFLIIVGIGLVIYFYRKRIFYGDHAKQIL